MAVATQWVIDKMEAWAPAAWAEEWDNVGLLVGDSARPIERVLTALDLSEAVLREAVQGRYDFIVTHHPLFREPVARITTETTVGKKIMTLIGNGIGLFCAHTNLDAAEGGTNDLLFDALGLTHKETLLKPAEEGLPGLHGRAADACVCDQPAMGRIGSLPQTLSLFEFAEAVGRAINLPNIRYVGTPNKPVQKVGLCSGNGTHPMFLDAALAKNCDVYVTGDLRYHQALEMLEAGMAVIDGTHYATENLATPAIALRLRSEAAKEGAVLTVMPSQVDGQVFRIT